MRFSKLVVMLVVLVMLVAGCGKSPVSPDVPPGRTETGIVRFNYDRPADTPCPNPPADCNLTGENVFIYGGSDWPPEYLGNKSVTMIRTGTNTYFADMVVPKGHNRGIRVMDAWHIGEHGIAGEPWGRGISANGKRLCDSLTEAKFDYDPATNQVTPAPCGQ